MIFLIEVHNFRTDIEVHNLEMLFYTKAHLNDLHVSCNEEICNIETCNKCNKCNNRFIIIMKI